tara:strand:- start:216 stop:1388 length:1173 start_codon:yes stop_codon:yes gene_type:complete
MEVLKMSIIQSLTEGMVQRDMRQEGQALLDKWTQTGLLEGLTDERNRSSMARLLENQAKELLRESSSMAAGDVEGFAAVAFPIVRRVFAGLIANDLVSVQPMSLPSGLIFFLDFTFSDAIGGSPRMGNTAGESIYGGDRVAKNIELGVNLVGDQKQGFSGPLRDGATGYAYASPSGSQNDDIGVGEGKYVTFLLDGSVSEANKKRIKFDPDLLSSADSSLRVLVADIDYAQIASDEGDPDFNNLSPFVMALTDLATDFSTGVTANTNCQQIRRLTDVVVAAEGLNGNKALRIVIAGPVASINANVASATALDNAIAQALITFPVKDQYDTGGAVGAVVGDLFALEGSSDIPEIDIKVDSIAITAQTKKLKAKWTPELGQDLNAYHNITLK